MKQTRHDPVTSAVILLIKRLAHDFHSAAPAQLASREVAVAKRGAQHGEEGFMIGLVYENAVQQLKEFNGGANEVRPYHQN